MQTNDKRQTSIYGRMDMDIWIDITQNVCEMFKIANEKRDKVHKKYDIVMSVAKYKIHYSQLTRERKIPKRNNE